MAIIAGTLGVMTGMAFFTGTVVGLQSYAALNQMGTSALTGFIAVATVLDMIHNGVSWLDVVALLVVLLFATGICGALIESLRRPRR